MGLTDDIKAKAQKVADDVQDKAEEVAENVKGAAEDAVDTAKENKAHETKGYVEGKMD